MITLLRHRSRETYLSEVPSLATSLLIAEVFYKFHSFVLECGAFLLTWLALSSALWLVVRKPAQ